MRVKRNSCRETLRVRKVDFRGIEGQVGLSSDYYSRAGLQASCLNPGSPPEAHTASGPYVTDRDFLASGFQRLVGVGSNAHRKPIAVAATDGRASVDGNILGRDVAANGLDVDYFAGDKVRYQDSITCPNLYRLCGDVDARHAAVRRTDYDVRIWQI
jgi:hypothetical protein